MRTLETEREKPAAAAHEALLTAWHATRTLRPESLAGAKKYFKEAIALDLEFALAHAGYSSHLFFRTHTTPSRCTFAHVR